MSDPRKRSTLYVYLLNPGREPEQARSIYIPVDVWRDLLLMTGIGLFFGVGKGSNIDATGEVLSALGREDKQGLSLVERGPRNLPPPPEQQHNTGEPYPGVGLQLNTYSTRGVVAIRRDEAEVIGKMLRVWAHLESARAAEIAAQPERALVTTRKRRHANEEHTETGRASQWTVPPHQSWITLAQELGEWLCAKTPEPTDVYISMNPDALEQAVRRDQQRAADEALGTASEDMPPNPAQTDLLARLQAELPGEWSDGGARGALLWVSPFTIAVSPAHGDRLNVKAEHLRDINQRHLILGWGSLRNVLADLVAETVCHRLWGGTVDGLGPAWAHVEVRKKLAEMRAQLTNGHGTSADKKTQMVTLIDRLLDHGLTGEEPPSVPPAEAAPTHETKVLTIQTRTWHSQKETANGGLVTVAHGQWCKKDGAYAVIGLYTVERELIADLARLGVVSSDDADVVMLTTNDPAVISVLVRHHVARGQLP